jgi:hypothetical protein
MEKLRTFDSKLEKNSISQYNNISVQVRNKGGGGGWNRNA